jgi:predicted amidohydrolase
MRHNIDKKLIAPRFPMGHVIIFPELSLTGYEPTLAKELAIHQDDKRLDDFQQISDLHGITIGLGAPTKGSKGICISMIFFQPHRERRLYSKKYLHADEYPYFVSGSKFLNIKR